jgi:amidohydrolase
LALVYNTDEFASSDLALVYNTDEFASSDLALVYETVVFGFLHPANYEKHFFGIQISKNIQTALASCSIFSKNSIFAHSQHLSMKEVKNKIHSLSKGLLGEITAYRRQIHSNPELAFEEHETAKLIGSVLQEAGIEFQSGIAKTGVMGIIKGKNPEKKVVALRADMDALPIKELNDVPYKSVNDGKMHACGHDVHTACLLGAAKILKALSDEFEGTVKLIFQPSEEKYPGGAKVMIAEGVLQNPTVDFIFGQHVYPDLEAGKIGLKSGQYMASTDEIFITVKGKGGHGATPHKNIDPVLIASHIIVALHQIISRNLKPVQASVRTFGRVLADGRTNVTPDEVKLEGIMRTFDESWRSEMKQRITKMAQSLTEGMGGKCEVVFDQGYPVLFNNEDLSARAKMYAVEYLGTENVADLELRTTAEDFAYFAQEIPGCFYRLGVRNDEKGITSNLHSATFNVDETSLETGMGLMAWMAWRELGNGRIKE